MAAFCRCEPFCCPGAGAIQDSLTAKLTALREERTLLSFSVRSASLTLVILAQMRLFLFARKTDSALLPSLDKLLSQGEDNWIDLTLCKQNTSPCSQLVDYSVKKKRSYYGSTVACTDLQNLAVPQLIRLRIKYLPQAL